MADLTQFSGRLQHARGDRGMTQSELAKLVECHDREIARYEQGAVKPREERLRRIATVLDVTPAWLLFGGPEATQAEADDVPNEAA